MDDQTDRIVKNLRTVIRDIIKEMSLNITSDLILQTPVDTGWAKSNWLPSIGEPIELPVGSKDAIDPLAQEVGSAEVAINYELESGSIFISNNVPYVPLLNEGHSPFAPAGFIDKIIEDEVRRQESRVL